MWTTWRQTRPRHASFAHVPTFAQVTRPSSRGSRSSSQGHRGKDQIDIYLYSQEARSPRLLFCWLFPSFRFWQAGEWERIRDESEPPCVRTPPEPNPRLCDRPFDFHVTASLLGTIATAFGRDRQLERPGDVICEGNRRIRAVQASSSWAHPFARSLSFTCQGLRVHHASFRCGHFCCKRCA